MTVNYDNLTPLYPDERLKLEVEDPTIKDKTTRVIDLRPGPEAGVYRHCFLESACSGAWVYIVLHQGNPFWGSRLKLVTSYKP